MITPQQFITKWGPGGPAFDLNEEQGAQSHFLDLCELLGVPKPGSTAGYRFEEKSQVIGGRTGYADVFLPGVFAWENKAPGKNLDTALKQLLTYSLALSNPPILVVSDRLTIRIHTQFTGHPSETHEVHIADIDQPDKLTLLRRIWTAPDSFKPKITNRDITEAAAKSFSTLAEGLRRRGASASDDAQALQQRANQVAHFLTQCLFCFFAEDVGLLPGRMFERLVTNRKITADKLTLGLRDLFTTMAGGGMFGADDIPWFNGGLFKAIDVPTLTIMDVTELRNAAELNWSAIDVSIFGTLFERGLDPAKRSQLGAHYTDPTTILRIVEPVVQRPLLQLWEHTSLIIRGLLAKSTKKGDKNYRAAQTRFIEWLDHLSSYRVLDPACGSGNFLFLGLKALKDIEHRSHLEAAALGLDREADLVTGPHNVLGIELNEYAAELARVTVWIGELQWRMAHGYEFKTNPVLEPLDHIECRDALLTFPVMASSSSLPVIESLSNTPVIASEARQSIAPCIDSDSSAPGSDSLATGVGPDSGARAAQMPGAHALRSLKSPPTSAPPPPLSSPSTPPLAVEASWPKASVVIGNPPFLGGSKKRRELGDAYFAALDSVFAGRVPGGADLVCYWFEKARQAIETNGLGAAGLVATNSIRGGSNRKVLDSICRSTRIYEAWSDETWVNDGAAVRVSLICFGHDSSTSLNGEQTGEILSDLTGTQHGAMTVDLGLAKRIVSNAGAVFEGLRKDGPLDISGETARQWLRLPNPHGKSNALVLFPLINGMDVTRRPRDGWVIDTGESLTVDEAALFEAPFAHIVRAVKPIRLQNNDRIRRTFWWRFGRNGEQLRAALRPIERFINTPRVAKHRLFVWQSMPSIADTATVAITRADDTTFGILHSRFHELWSLRMGTWLGVGNDPRYTPTTCFETYPFPAGLTPADTAHQRTETLDGGAVIPADLSESNRPVALVKNAQYATKTVATSDLTAVTSPALQARMGRRSGAISKSEAYEPPASAPSSPCEHQQSPRNAAIPIAIAAKRLNDLRENWLNPPEWTHKVPEVIPLGLEQSPYPDRVEPIPGITEADLKALQQRTLTKLYNQRPAWLTMAHQQLDAAVAAAYGWADYTPDLPDEEILKRLLALNLERSGAAPARILHSQ